MCLDLEFPSEQIRRIRRCILFYRSMGCDVVHRATLMFSVIVFFMSHVSQIYCQGTALRPMANALSCFVFWGYVKLAL